MIIAVASGKGGTGKTTVAVNLALSLQNGQFIDCDVEEPNAHLFLRPVIREKKKAFVLLPVVDETKCNYCGKCREVCAYNAIVVLPPGAVKNGKVLIFPHLCHSCGACSMFCPLNAISEENKEIGTIELGETNGLEFVQGCLNISEAMSPPLIRQVKKYIDVHKTVIIDAPPGTSCPVISAIKGSDFCILVTEPTPFGLNDLILAVEVVRKLKIPFGVVLNKADLGNNKVEEYCNNENISIMMRIPFNREIAFAYSSGIPMVSGMPEYKSKFRDLFNNIKERINYKNQI